MHRRDFLRLSGLTPFAVPRAGRQPAAPAGDPFEAIAAVVRDAMTRHHVPGVGLGIWHADRLQLRGFGVTSLDDPRPITADTLFTIASISKTMTATAVMRLVHQGRLELHTPVHEVWPEFRVRDEAATAQVTPWHLLTHTPGWEGQLTTEDRGAQALSHFVASIMPSLPQLAAPGETWSYNNAGFALAGRLIEVVTGRGIHDALGELVFAPLGLSRTFTRLTDVLTHPVTLGHRQRDGRTEVIRPYQTTSSTTAGGVATSLTDLMRYARFHLGDGTAADGTAYLHRPRLAQMQQAQVAKHGTDDEMGLGWHLRRVGGLPTLAHGGTLNGHCLLVQLVPERQLAFTVLTNHVDGWRLVQEVERTILQRYAGVALTRGQRIGHRGVNEAMDGHATPLAAQPAPADYLGRYARPPVGEVTVRADGSRLLVATGGGQPESAVVFYGPDVAYAVSGSYTGMPFEFVRDAGGAVRWIRVNGRIARRA
ncbi:MAG: serine hydrolase domain-containing protein [Dehalococcoidia bacterium]